MLTSLLIKDFKSLSSAELRLTPLTLFAGPNSSGKSSAIQALLFAVDNLSVPEDSHRLICKRQRMLTFNESRNFLTNAKRYSIGISDDKYSVELDCTAGDEAFRFTDVVRTGEISSYMAHLSNDGLLYLPADRNADLSRTSINNAPDSNLIGINAEYLIDYFYNNRKKLVDTALLSEGEIRTVETLLNQWLKKLTDYEIVVEPQESEYVTKFQTPYGKIIPSYGVGTGVSFIVEILIVCLLAKKGDVVVIENPEIHLHPAAQADLIDFFVMVANSGIQVILESHSDHFFNGIRRLLHSGTLSLANVSVYNFTKAEFGTNVEAVKLNQSGGIENYIPGMFEQFDDDLDELWK